MSQEGQPRRADSLLRADELEADLRRITPTSLLAPPVLAVLSGIVAHQLTGRRIDPSFFAATSEGLLAFAALVPAGYGLIATRAAARLDRGRLLRARPIGLLTALFGATLLLALSASLIGINADWGRVAAAAVFALTLLVALWSATLIGLLVWQVSPSRSTRYAVSTAIDERRDEAGRESIVKELRDLALAEAGRESMDRHALHDRAVGLASIVALLPREQERLARFTLDELAFVAEETVLDRDVGTTMVKHLCAIAERSPHLLLPLRERAVEILHKAAVRGASPHVRQALEDALCTTLGPNRLTLAEALHSLSKAIRLVKADPSTGPTLLSDNQLKLVARRALVLHAESGDNGVIDRTLAFALWDVGGLGELDDPTYAGQLVRELVLRAAMDGNPKAVVALMERAVKQSDERWNGLTRLADTLLPYLHNVLAHGLNAKDVPPDEGRRETQALSTRLVVAIGVRILWLEARNDGATSRLDEGALDRTIGLLVRLVDDSGRDRCADRDAEFVHRQTGWLALQALGGLSDPTPSGARIALGLLPVLIASGSAAQADGYAAAWLAHLVDSFGPARVADSIANSTAALLVRVLELARSTSASATDRGDSPIVPDDNSDDLRAITIADAAESALSVAAELLRRDTRGPSYLRPTPADRSRHLQFRRWLDRLAPSDRFVHEVARCFDGANSTTWADAGSRWRALHASWKRSGDAAAPELRALTTSVVSALPSLPLVIGHTRHDETGDLYPLASEVLDWMNGRRTQLSASERAALDSAVAIVHADPRHVVLEFFERVDALPSDPTSPRYKTAFDRVARRIGILPTTPLALDLATDLTRARQGERKLSFGLQSELFEWFLENRFIAGTTTLLYGWLNYATRRVTPTGKSKKLALETAERLESLSKDFCELLLASASNRHQADDGSPSREISGWLLETAGAIQGVRTLLDTEAEERVAARIVSTLLTLIRGYPSWSRVTEMENRLAENFGRSEWWEDVVSLR